MKTIDMRGKPCPMPVVAAKKALAESGEGVIVLVDNTVATSNLERLANSLGCAYSCEKQASGEYTVTLIPGEAPISDGEALPDGIACPVPEQPKGSVVLITSDQMGRGGEELGAILIKGFLFSLTELPVPPEAVLFLNAGVKLAVEGANTLPDLKALEDKGVIIRSCGTCLNYFGLTQSLAVGEVTDMFGISRALAEAHKVISI